MIPTNLKIRYYGDPCLRKETNVVNEVGVTELKLIEAMIATMHEHQGVGLAAPQVGINEQIFVADVGEGPLVFVNPKILKSSGSGTLEEGCLSIPEVTINVTRPETITVEYTDHNNQKHKQKFTELLARVIQHETDHLHGKLIVDYASDEEKETFKEQLEKLEQQSKN